MKRITAGHAEQIRKDFQNGKTSVDLAAKFGCTARHINRIVSNDQHFSLSWELTRPKNDREFDLDLALLMYEHKETFSYKDIARSCTLIGPPFTAEAVRKKISRELQTRNKKENE